MIIFALLMMWAYPVAEYQNLTGEKDQRTNPFRAFLDALNFWDFVKDVSLYKPFSQYQILF